MRAGGQLGVRRPASGVLRAAGGRLGGLRPASGVRRAACGLLAGALAACGQAGAAPVPAAAATAVAGPKGWTASEPIAQAVHRAVTSREGAVTGTQAWAEPARGCYALALELRGAAADRNAVANEVVVGLALGGIAVDDVVPPAGEAGALTFTFARPPYHGRARAELATGGAIAARACFWNDREPAACQAACTEWLR